MYRVGVIGDRGSALSFKAVGLDVFLTESGEEARAALKRMANDKYAIIYITEKLCGSLKRDIEKYKDSHIPAIIPIPGTEGSHGIGFANLKKSVERAVGADILFDND